MNSFNRSINDWAIRIAQLEQALNSVTRHKLYKPGLVQANIRSEIELLKEQINLSCNAGIGK